MTRKKKTAKAVGFLSGYEHNFDTLCRARDNRQLALVECLDAVTQQKIAVVAAAYKTPDGVSHIVPIARMFDGNPYETLLPPIMGMTDQYMGLDGNPVTAARTVS